MDYQEPLLILRESINLADKGYTAAGEWLLHEYCNVVKERSDPSAVVSQEYETELLGYFANKFKVMLGGVDSGTALNIKKRPGGQFSIDGYRRNIEIAKDMLTLMDEKGEGMTIAVASVALSSHPDCNHEYVKFNKYPLSDRKIQKIYAEFGTLACIEFLAEKLEEQD